MTELSLITSRIINAPIEKVFNAWLSPEMLKKFMLAGEGMTIPSATTEPKVGGRFSILMVMDGKELPHEGTYLEIDPHSRIAFSWESPYSADGSKVTLDLKPTGGEATELTLTHVKFNSENSRDNHKAGWTKILALLASQFE